MRRLTSLILSALYFLNVFALILTVDAYEVQDESEQMESVQESEKKLKGTDEYILERPEKPKRQQTECVYIGEFTCTAYCKCAKCCGKYSIDRPTDERGNEVVYGSSGEVLTPNKSVAVDPSVIPFGTVLMIDGIEYIAQDAGAFRGLALDFYMNSHAEACEFGRQTKAVFIKITK